MLLNIVIYTFVILQTIYAESSSPWHYECRGGYCKKTEKNASVKTQFSLEVCQLFCGDGGALWPKPTGHYSLGHQIAHLNLYKLEFYGLNPSSNAGGLVKRIVERLKTNLRHLSSSENGQSSNGLSLRININDVKDPNDVKLTLQTDESYLLKIYQPDVNYLNATISASTYFGVRHALETLSQLIVYNDLSDEIQIAWDVHIEDGPVYPYRGVLLDTSRNFIDKQTILRTIEAMGMSKLNTFHWHITDSHSFPYISKSLPKMSEFGAYNPRKVYTNEDVKEIIDYGLLKGVRVLPEFDAPAHVGEGWQWIDDDVTVCFKKEPWTKYCVEPPCGQLNPTNDKVYHYLEKIYTDMIEDFQPDIFHMGGDEVNINCWNSSEIIRNWMKNKGWDLSKERFIDLWDHFQMNAYDKLKLANGGKDIPVVIWTSELTNKDNLKYLDPEKYIIQIWTTGTDETIGRLVQNDFKVIFSNYDALYLDCGFGAWVGEGVNWCAPYKGWQKVYENSPAKILRGQGYQSKKHLILGGEAALWTEQVDSTSVDSRLWPRSAAMAERLWGEPQSTWLHAEQRFYRHRERLVQRGILADSLVPEWCFQNQNQCYL